MTYMCICAFKYYLSHELVVNPNSNSSEDFADHGSGAVNGMSSPKPKVRDGIQFNTYLYCRLEHHRRKIWGLRQRTLIVTTVGLVLLQAHVSKNV